GAGISANMDTLIFNSPRTGIVKRANNKTEYIDGKLSIGYSGRFSEKRKKDSGSVHKSNEVFIENTLPGAMRDRDEFISRGRAELPPDNWVYKLLYNV